MGNTRILTFRTTLIGSNNFPGYSQVKDFTVTTGIPDVSADAFNFSNRANLEVSTAYNTTETIIVTGLTPNFPVPITVNPTANLIINSVNQGSRANVVNGDQVAVQATSASTYITAKQYTVGIGPAGSITTDSFYFTTRLPDPHWPPIFGNLTSLEPSSFHNTPNTVGFQNMDVPIILSVNNSGNMVVNGIDQSSNIATINNGDTVNILGQASSSYSTTRTFTVTGNVLGTLYTTTFSYRTRDEVTCAQWDGSFGNLNNQELNTVVTSDAHLVSGFDGSKTITLSSTPHDSTAQLVINGNLSGNSNTVSAGANVAIQGTTRSNQFYETVTYTAAIAATGTCTTNTNTWITRTKSNDDLLIFTPY
jgi:hypothetical protein